MDSFAVCAVLRDLASSREPMQFPGKQSSPRVGPCGYTDVHLLASVRLEGTARLWTRDRRLLALAVELEVEWVEGTGASL